MAVRQLARWLDRDADVQALLACGVLNKTA